MHTRHAGGCVAHDQRQLLPGFTLHLVGPLLALTQPASNHRRTQQPSQKQAYLPQLALLPSRSLKMV